MDELTRLRTEAQTAGSEAGKLQESVPGLLSGLKSNLNSIFTKDNPEFAQRENALTNFLNIPSQTRAELLPQNQPIFGGSRLNVSPSQQEAIVTARRNAALVPLAGLNQSIVGQYGNLMDMLTQTGDIYKTQVLGAQNQASIAQKAFENALAQEKEAREGRTAGNGQSFFDWYAKQFGQGAGVGQKPPIESFETPDTTPAPQNIEIPGQGIIQPYTPAPIPGPSAPGRWNPLAQLGAVGELFWNGLTGGQTASPVNPNTNLNILQANNDPNRISFAGK